MLSDKQAPPDSGASFDEVSHALTLVIRSGKVQSYKDEMDAKVKEKEGEIETLCNLHYQNFVQSVDQLLALRTTANDLKKKMTNLHSDLQTVGLELVKKKREIIEQKRIVLNMEDAIETLTACAAALKLITRAQQHVASRKFYGALQILSDLQKNHMLTIAPFKFALAINACIPQIREKIRTLVFNELKEWLVEIRENCYEIGRVAIEKQQTLFAKAQSANLPSPLNDTSPSNAPRDFYDDEDADGFNSDALDELLDKLKFRPLYQCLHIHEVLGKKEEFKASFEEIRRVHCDLWIVNAHIPNLEVDPSLQSLTKAQIDNLISALEQFLDAVAGFFLMETIIIDSTSDFRSKEAVQQLWQIALNRVIDIVSDTLLDRVDPDLFLRIKATILKFSRAIEKFNFSPDQLTSILFTHLQAMVHVMEQQLRALISAVIDEDAYSPMLIESQQALDKIEAVVGVVLKSVDNGRLLRNFPRTLPFSKGFVTLLEYTKKFIGMFYDFISGFSQYYSELNDLIKKSLETIVSEYMVDSLVEKLGSGSNLSQAVQIIINLEYLEFGCKELEAALERAQARCGRHIAHIALNSTSVVSDAKRFGEMRIFEVTNSKIDEFFELADYDWEAQVIRNKPLPFFADMVEYLTTVVTSTLLNLELVLRASIYFSVFQHICDTMKTLLLNGKHSTSADTLQPQRKQSSFITIQAIESFNLDLMFLETFAKTLASSMYENVLTSPLSQQSDFIEPISDFDASSVSLKQLVNVLLPLRQLVDLARTPQPEDILNPEIKRAKYSKVVAADAIKLLEKLKGEGNVSFFAKSVDKKRRDKLETLIKQLKLTPI